MEDDDAFDDFLSDDTLSEISFSGSEPDNSPQSVNIDISNGSPFNNDDFIVLHYNINSITAEGRLEELAIVTSTLKVGVLICTESKLSQIIPNNIIKIPGYHEPVRHDRTRHGGGCLMYISERLTFKHKIDFQSLKYEHIWVDIRVNEKLYAINAFYRPPNESAENHSEFLEEADQILSNLSKYNAETKLIASDLNFGNTYCKSPILPPKPLDSSAPDLFASHGFTQLIDIPTRITENSTSLISLIFVSNTDSVQRHGTLPRIADHDGVVVSFHCARNKSKVLTKTIFDYKNMDEKGLLNFIKNYNFESTVFTKPVIEQASAFTNVLSEAISNFIPLKKVVIRECDQPWVNSYTRLLLRRKNRNYQFYKRINNQYVSALNCPNTNPDIFTRLTEKKTKAFQKCKNSDKESFNANRRAKQAFYDTVNSTMKNHEISAKKKFNILTKLMKNQKNSLIPPLIENNDVINDSQTKSNLFNDLFVSKAKVSGNNDPVPELPARDDILSSFSHLNTSPLEVAKIIRNLKKSNSSHCGVPGKFLSLIATPVSFPLYRLYNNLFRIGHFPDIFKIAQVTALYKRAGLKSSKLQYRPISLLPTLSKVMESIIHARLLEHFNKNNIISERQAAYLKGDSTIQQLLFIVHFIKTSWTKGKITQGVFLDVSAAFDKCWHSGLLAKLEQVKVEESSLDLFKSYLSNRKQFVVVDGSKSNIKDVEAGVPQGSRLGPLLWILFVNDIIDDLETEVLLFADDTCLFATADDPSETAEMLNRDLEKIQQWAVKWKVSFNPSKSKDMIFSKKNLSNSPPVVFNNTFVSRVHEHRHLGVWLSSSLEWSKQVREVCLKANGKLAVLRSVRFLNRSTLDLLYKLTIRSVIDYGLIVYFHSLKVTQVARLTQIQYRAAKLCTGALHFTNQSKLEDDLGWEKISTRADFLGLSLFQKIHLRQTRPLILKCMPQLNHNRKNRNTNVYQNFPALGSDFSGSFFPHFTKCFNKLEPKVTAEHDLVAFKENLKVKMKPRKIRHYGWGSKRGNTLWTQLRVGRSFLNAHGFAINLSDSDLCLCSRSESVSHFFTECFLYAEERRLLYDSMEQILPKFKNYPIKTKLEILLNGINLNSEETDSRNSKIIYAVQNFILKTKRF